MPRGGIGGLVQWRGAPPPAAAGAGLLEPIRHRGLAGVIFEARGPAAMGQAVFRSPRRLEERATSPWGRCGELAVAADARLFNGPALGRRLDVDGGADRPAVAGLLRAAYRRWGPSFVERLDGEFALAIWDGWRRRLLLARDPFGCRPLFYRVETGRTLFASEPKQILLQPGVTAEPDPLVVGEYLLGRFEELGRTFFRGVRRLRPGHLLLIEAGRGEPRPFWLPQPEEKAAAPDNGLERFRAGLEGAVNRRLLAGQQNAAHLSGGLDSASIVLSAARDTRLTAVSCRFPGLPCDETEYIRQVAAAVPFRHRFVDPLELDPLAGLEEDLWRLDSPFADLQRGQFLALSRAIRDSGARQVLTGLGGDELVLEESYLQDLALRGRWSRLAVEAVRASRFTRDSLGYLLRDALRPVAPPGLRSLYRRLRGRQAWRPPAWAATGFVDEFLAAPEPPPSPHAGLASRTQDTILRNVQHPEVCWALEALECRAAERGYLPSHPFLDRGLVETVLAMPFEERIPRGRWKRLLRDGLADRLPRAVRERRDKTIFDSFDRHLLARHFRPIRERLFAGGEWASQRFVTRRGAAALFASCGASGCADPRQRQELWRVATVELWHRQLERYNRTVQHVDQTTIRNRGAVARVRP